MKYEKRYNNTEYSILDSELLFHKPIHTVVRYDSINFKPIP